MTTTLDHGSGMALSDQELEVKIQALEREKKRRQANLDKRTTEVEKLKVEKAYLEEMVRLKQALERQRLLNRRSTEE